MGGKSNRMMSIAVGAGVSLILAGCATSTRGPAGASVPAPVAPPPPPPQVAAMPVLGMPAPREADFVQVRRRNAPVHAVNAFGEFDGAARPVIALSSETGMQQHTVCDEGYDADVAVDPTGKWLAFASTRNSEHADIYLQRTDGASVIELTSDPADDVQPCFSPDGKKIAFASNRNGNWDIYLMDVDGKNVQQVTAGPAQKMHPSFSPDCTRLVYCSLSSRTDQWELWVQDLEHNTRKMIGYGLFPSWSPQKPIDRIAFQKARQRGSRWFSVWTVDLVNGEPRRLTEVAVASNAAVVSPAWSPDGARLAFSTILVSNETESHPRAGQDIWVIDADGTGRRQLTGGVGLNVSPCWAPAGRLFFISDRGGHENVWSVPAGSPEPAPATAAADKPAAPATPAAKKETPTEVGATDTREIGR